MGRTRLEDMSWTSTTRRSLSSAAFPSDPATSSKYWICGKGQRFKAATLPPFISHFNAPLRPKLPPWSTPPPHRDHRHKTPSPSRNIPRRPTISQLPKLLRRPSIIPEMMMLKKNDPRSALGTRRLMLLLHPPPTPGALKSTPPPSPARLLGSRVGEYVVNAIL